jgi:predicted RNA polymerase sigma factor
VPPTCSTSLHCGATPTPQDGSQAWRWHAVQSILYLMFTEGNLSSDETSAIRRELCDEAKRLALLLAQHALGGTSETCTLLALMHLHAARMTSRLNEAGVCGQ